ncbi:MAG: sigma-54 dependent transcriptional regulator [candidate division WOR-3 bacterium]
MGRKINLLIIDDEPLFSATLKDALSTHYNFNIIQAFSGFKAIEIFEQMNIDICFLDVHLPDINGFDLIKKIKNFSPDCEIIIMTAYGELEQTKLALKEGAYFLPKPFKIEDIKIILSKINKKIEQSDYEKIKEEEEQIEIKTNNKKMKEIVKKAEKYAKSDLPVLLLGSTGTGKDTMAKYIHQKSDRKNEIFIMQNCASLPETLIESELFGYEKGAFTGAYTRKYGLFEIANNGTIFLNEIGELPLSSQAKILHIIENKSFRRIGGVNDIFVDTRIIAATNKKIDDLLKSGKIREDLFFRLETLHIELPDLKDRLEDIPLIIESLLKKRNIDPKDFQIDKEIYTLFQNYSWPGNIRELENIIDRSIILTEGKGIFPDTLPYSILKLKNGIKKESLKDLEKDEILKTLNSVGGNKTKAAKILGIDRKTLYRKLKKWGI